MNKTIFLALMLFMANFSFAQVESTTVDETKKNIDEVKKRDAETQKRIGEMDSNRLWKKGMFFNLNFNQASFTNWAAGGQNSISGASFVNFFANYKKNKVSWVNSLDLSYGLLKNSGEEVRKNEDRIDLFSKFGYAINKKFNYASLVNFKSQFAEGLDFSNPDADRPVISKFLAPAFLLTSIGVDYVPNDNFSVYLSPATMKLTIVTDDSISFKGLWGMEAGRTEDFRSEFGALLTAIYQNASIFKNVGIRSKLDLFNNYLDPNKPNRNNIDINWETALDFKINKYIGASLLVHAIYDDDINIEYDPENQPGKFGPRTQWKQIFGLGFSYKLIK